MCVNCWAEYGSPAEWNDRVRDGLALTVAIYEEECTGGPMHAVLDDWNIDGQIEAWKPDQFSPDVADASRRLAALMNEMTVAERASMLAYHDSMLPVPS
jgi:hypothetical protein